MVEVERMPTRAALPSKAAVEGSMITFEETDCTHIGCPNYRLCRPADASEGMRFRIVSVGEEIECLMGRSLRITVLD